MLKLAFEIEDEKIKIGINLFGKYIFLYTKSIYEILFSPLKKKTGKGKEIEDIKERKRKKTKLKREIPEFKKVFRIIQNFGKTIKYDSAYIEIPINITDEPDLFPLLSILQEIPRTTIGLSYGTKIKILFKVRFVSAFKLAFSFLKLITPLYRR